MQADLSLDGAGLSHSTASASPSLGFSFAEEDEEAWWAQQQPETDQDEDEELAWLDEFVTEQPRGGPHEEDASDHELDSSFEKDLHRVAQAMTPVSGKRAAPSQDNSASHTAEKAAEAEEEEREERERAPTVVRMAQREAEVAAMGLLTAAMQSYVTEKGLFLSPQLGSLPQPQTNPNQI